MAYTVNKLATMSGVSVRTLHFYDQIGLLPPAYIGDNGYRYYEEEQLLLLQQILFYRELGMPLDDIQKAVQSVDFDKVAALEAHRGSLARELVKTERLIKTIDQTIAKLKGGIEMKDEDMYVGFSQEKQEAYERELIDRYGEATEARIWATKERMKGWTKADHERIGAELDAILRELAMEIVQGARPEDSTAQALIARHVAWLCHYWTPDRASYAALGKMYVEHPDYQAFYSRFHPGLAAFLAEAMQVYADAQLS